jgi:hypothetical protein
MLEDVGFDNSDFIVSWSPSGLGFVYYYLLVTSICYDLVEPVNNSSYRRPDTPGRCVADTRLLTYCASCPFIIPLQFNRRSIGATHAKFQITPQDHGCIMYSYHGLLGMSSLASVYSIGRSNARIDSDLETRKLIRVYFATGRLTYVGPVFLHSICARM